MHATLNETLMETKFEESIWCNVSLHSTSILIGLCYRSPASDNENDKLLLELLDNAMQQFKTQHTLIMGDFNFPEINYYKETVEASNTASSAIFLQKIQEWCLFQFVTEPTRIRPNQIPSVLDYIFMDEHNLVENMQYETPMGKSDHITLRWGEIILNPENRFSSKKS